jgi:hypothetical protein
MSATAMNQVVESINEAARVVKAAAERPEGKNHVFRSSPEACPTFAERFEAWPVQKLRIGSSSAT